MIVLMSLFTLYLVQGLDRSSRIYEAVQNEQNRAIYSGKLAEITFPGSKTIYITSWDVFLPGHTWTLVSGQNPIDDNFAPDNLVDTALPHGDADRPMKFQQQIAEPLARLFEAAEAAGYPLMLSSSYRSVSEQQSIYDSFVASKGEEEASRYVAKPGTSEHHTGLSIDISNLSDACASNSDLCSLGVAEAMWLEENAHNYGFIQRYPEGKQPITGIAFEPWHYRYVGPILAPAIFESKMTLDEALTQMRPAFSVAR